MNEIAVDKESVNPQAKGLHPAKGLLVVLAIAVAVVLFLLLTSSLGINEFWAGFLWLFFWAGVEHMRFDRLNQSVVGACVGLGAAMALKLFPQWLGVLGLVAALAIVVVLVYCQVMGWFSLLVNNATMLFLTVATIPHLQGHGDFGQIYTALVLGVVFFGGLLWVGFRFARLRADRKS